MQEIFDGMKFGMKLGVLEIVLIAIVSLIVTVVIRVVKNIRKQKEILFSTAARGAREEEKFRKRLVKKVERQMEIGDPIYRMLMGMWDKAGHPSDRKVSRVSNCNGVYKIEVNHVNTLTQLPTVINRLMLVIIDIWQPKQIHVEIGAGDHHEYLATYYEATRQIENITNEFKIFKA